MSNKYLLDALRFSESRYRRLFESARDGILLLNFETAAIEDVNPYLMELLGYTYAEFMGKKVWEIGPFHNTHLSQESFMELQEKGIIRYDDMPLESKSGEKIEVEFVSNVYDCDGIKVIQCNIRDIRPRKKTEANMRMAAKVFESSGEAMMITDAEAYIISINQAFTRLTGYTLEEVQGRNPRMLASGKQDANFYHTMWEALNKEGYWQGEIWDKHKDGHIYPKWMSISTVHDEHGQVSNYISIATDVTARKQAEQRIQFLAYFDVLTDLPNRTLLHDRLEQLVAASHRDNHKFALMFIDLDHFKYVNDSMGHEVGDELLKAVALHLQQCVREGDTVSRIGGDEFIVLLRETENEGAASVAEKMLALLSSPYDIGDLQISTHASIGISIYPDHGGDADTLTKQADIAMYYAKDKGRNNYQFFTPD
ncbi:MAG: diguanylate cyclase, partial [Gallionellaceae bacterium]|nr:diguanylate cyclase [Gallionellaceae bacterium]